MERPRPSVTSENLYDAYFEKAKDFANQFAAYETIIVRMYWSDTKLLKKFVQSKVKF